MVETPVLLDDNVLFVNGAAVVDEGSTLVDANGVEVKLAVLLVLLVVAP